MLMKRRYVYIIIRFDDKEDLENKLFKTFKELFGETALLSRPIKLVYIDGAPNNIFIIRCYTKFLPEVVYTLYFLIMGYDMNIEFIGIETTLKRVKESILIFI